MNPLLLVDSYKINHTRMYPDGMTKLYSNFTPRKSRIEGIDKVVVFGIQHFILEYLIKKFNQDFFYTEELKFASNSPHKIEGDTSNYRKDERIYKRSKNKVINEYKCHCNVDTKHIEALWDLGYLPIEIKALDEGTLCPIGVPCMTITNTHPEFGWLVNYLETLISCMLWQPITSATISHEYRKILDKYAIETTGTTEGVQWQGHDFSMRGMSSVESAILSGMGHLLSFTGTDTIPAIYQLEDSYKAQGLIGASVPATEHSIECMNAMGTMEGEYEHTLRLLKLYPTGIVSKVSDTTDLWSYITQVLPKCKSEIMGRDGKLVIRPDSGDPVDIICGLNSKYYTFTLDEEDDLNDWLIESENNEGEIFKFGDSYYKILDVEEFIREYGWENTNLNFKDMLDGRQSLLERIEIKETSEFKGVIELLWDIFGGTINDKGYKVLDSHIGAIYGDSITMDRAKQICERLKSKGFASTNIVLGIGSYTYQYNTRDTFGFAMKATYGELDFIEQNTDTGNWHGRTEKREIFKDPITDDGTKKSKKGLLRVLDGHSGLRCFDQCSWEQEKTGLLTTVFKDGKLIKETTLEEIRNKLNNN